MNSQTPKVNGPMLATPEQLAFKKPSGFIVFEGVNGAGKSTLLNRINDTLTTEKVSFLRTFEPGATHLGKSLRKLLLENDGDQPCSLAELLLFGADRAEHVQKVIKPALAQKTLVLSDRYFYSTVAFQGFGRGLNRDLVESINRIAIDQTVPDLVILLDLDPAEGLKRTSKRSGEGKDSFEAESLAFHTRIREGFLDLAKTRPEPFLVLDASQSADIVFEQAYQAVTSVLVGLS